MECRPKRLRDRWTHHRPDSSRGQSGFMRIAFQDRASDSQDSVPVVGGRSEARMSVPPSDTLKASLRCRTQSPDFLDWDWVFSASGGLVVAFFVALWHRPWAFLLQPLKGLASSAHRNRSHPVASAVVVAPKGHVSITSGGCQKSSRAWMRRHAYE